MHATCDLPDHPLLQAEYDPALARGMAAYLGIPGREFCARTLFDTCALIVPENDIRAANDMLGERVVFATVRHEKYGTTYPIILSGGWTLNALLKQDPNAKVIAYVLPEDQLTYCIPHEAHPFKHPPPVFIGADGTASRPGWLKRIFNKRRNEP